MERIPPVGNKFRCYLLAPFSPSYSFQFIHFVRSYASEGHKLRKYCAIFKNVIDMTCAYAYVCVLECGAQHFSHWKLLKLVDAYGGDNGVTSNRDYEYLFISTTINVINNELEELFQLFFIFFFSFTLFINFSDDKSTFSQCIIRKVFSFFVHQA